MTKEEKNQMYRAVTIAIIESFYRDLGESCPVNLESLNDYDLAYLAEPVIEYRNKRYNNTRWMRYTVVIGIIVLLASMFIILS